MDFTPSPEQQAVADVVSAALHRELSWDGLVSGGVTALPMPARLGGDNVGLREVATAMTQIGQHGLVSPALATLGLGVVPLLELATEAAQDRFLAGVANGALLTAALNEPGAPLPTHCATILRNGRLSGTKVSVSYAAQADWMIVTATGTPDSVVLVVSPQADGVQLTKTPTSSGADEYVVSFADVAVPDQDVLVGATVQRVNQLALAMIGAFVDGLVAGALRLTADYVAHRHQFGKPLATFQSVAAQLAEVYITSRTLGLIAKSVVWQLAQHRDADPDLAVLGYWLTAQAPPAMQTCHHLHGGIGVDITYPMSRYYSACKDLTRLLGGPSHQLNMLAGICSSN